MSGVPGARGRPATLKKASIELDDDSEAQLRLVGDGRTVQVTLPEKWSLAKFDRAISTNGGRTQISFTKD